MAIFVHLPYLLVVVAASLSSSGASDIYCGCHVSQRRDTAIAIHCSRNREGASAINCEKDMVPDLPDGYRFVPGYGLYKLYRTFTGWEQAIKMCERDGATLVIPQDKTHVTGLQTLFSHEPGIWYALTGINDLQSEGLYAETDGKPAPYLSWAKGEPNNKNGNEHCVAMGQDGLMNDFPCDQPAPVLCERRLAVQVPADYRWVPEAGRFLRRHDDKLAFPQAQRVCEGENATLAVTDTWRRGEAALRLLQTSYQPYLVGFTDEKVEGDFVTSTGRHLNDMEFRVWGKGEPNNNHDGRPENCLALLGIGQYNDVRCDRELPFICEIVPI